MVMCDGAIQITRFQLSGSQGQLLICNYKKKCRAELMDGATNGKGLIEAKRSHRWVKKTPHLLADVVREEDFKHDDSGDATTLIAAPTLSKNKYFHDIHTRYTCWGAQKGLVVGRFINIKHGLRGGNHPQCFRSRWRHTRITSSALLARWRRRTTRCYCPPHRQHPFSTRRRARGIAGSRHSRHLRCYRMSSRPSWPPQWRGGG